MRPVRLASVPLGLALLLAAPSASGLPAFPGAEGFGAVATGGRGGRVIKVTTLAARGTGSLQAALDARGPRVIVFAVSGVIRGDVTINQGDVTIAGQTAPGAGITIAGRFHAKYDSTVNNLIVRFLRVRPIYDGSSGEQFDGIQMSLNNRLILDHVSASWGVDETIDMYEASDVTVQWSSIVESATAGHPEGQHNYGFIQGPDGERIAMHHDFFAHHKSRTPAIANGPAEVRDNVMYDVRQGFVHHNPARGEFNFVGNTFIKGPSAPMFPLVFDNEDGPGAARYFLRDNAIDDPGTLVGIVEDPWRQPLAYPGLQYIDAPASTRAPGEHDFRARTGFVPVTTQASAEARRHVLARAGALPHDVVDRRCAEDAIRRSGAWGARPAADLMEGLQPGTPPPDADDDGIADAWEAAHGLSASNASDATRVMPSGYMAIEEYVNELADKLVADTPVPPPDPNAPGAGGADGGAGTGGGDGIGGDAGGGIGGPGSPSGAGGPGGVGAGDAGGSAAAPGGDGAGDEGGCLCATPPRRPRAPWTLLLLGLGAMAAGLRRRAAA